MKGENSEQRWCDDVSTPRHETCEELAGRAFDLAAPDLERRFGGIVRWGEAHKAQGIHRPFGVVPFVDRFFNIEPETPGDSYTVDVGAYTIRDAENPFGNRHAPSLRAIYDFADLDRSLYMQSTGQSGNVLSPWYSNLAERWAQVEYITIPTRRPAIEAAHTLTLTP
jgi:penicillin amidase